MAAQSDQRPPIHHQVIDHSRRAADWVVMVHGFTHNSAYFSAQVLEFQKDYRLLLVDLRGHGRSTDLDGPYGVEEYADDIAAALDEAGVERPHYWGTHTGAAVGLVLALRYPERFASLVLEGPSLPGFPMPLIGELIDRARGIARSSGVGAALDDWFDHAGWFDYIREHPIACRASEHRAMVFGFSGAPWLCDLAPRPVTPAADCLPLIRRPVLVYNGAHDLADFRRAALHLEANLPDVCREEIPDAGGFPAWENPRAVNALVRHFLAAHPR